MLQLLMLYICGGVIASLTHLGWALYTSRRRRSVLFSDNSRVFWPPVHDHQSVGALGASGSVQAIGLANVLMFPTQTILLYGLIPVPAALLGLLWLWNDLGGVLDGHQSQIAHAGHLGGAFTGLAFYLAFRRGMIRP